MKFEWMKMDYYVVWSQEVRNTNGSGYADYHAYIDFSGRVNLSKNISNEGAYIQFVNHEVKCIQLVVASYINNTLYALFENGCVESIHTDSNIYPNCILESLDIKEPICKLDNYFEILCMLSLKGNLYFNKDIVIANSNIINFQINSDILVIYYNNDVIEMYTIEYIGGHTKLTKSIKFDDLLAKHSGNIKTTFLELNSLVLILDNGEIICNNDWVTVKKTEYYSIIRIMDADKYLFIGLQANKFELMACVEHTNTEYIIDAIESATTEICYTIDTIRYSKHINLYKQMEYKYMHVIGTIKVIIMMDDTVRTFRETFRETTEVFDIFEDYPKLCSDVVDGTYI